MNCILIHKIGKLRVDNPVFSTFFVDKWGKGADAYFYNFIFRQKVAKKFFLRQLSKKRLKKVIHNAISARF